MCEVLDLNNYIHTAVLFDIDLFLDKPYGSRNFSQIHQLLKEIVDSENSI